MGKIDRLDILKYYNKFLCIFIILLIFSEFGLYSFTKEILPLSMVHWTIIILGLSLPLVILRQANIRNIVQQPLLYWLIGLLYLTIVYSFSITNISSSSVIQQVNRYILSSLLLFSFVIVFSNKDVLQISRQTIILILSANVIINIIDFFSLNVDMFSPILARAAGMYYNPNYCGIVFILGYLVVRDIITDKYKFLFTIWVLLGIVLTQSRGAIILFFAIILYNIYTKYYSFKSIIITSLITISLSLGSIGYVLETYSSGFLFHMQYSDGMFDRLKQITGGSADHLTHREDPRILLLRYYSNLFLDKPFLGHGIGASLHYTKSSPDGTASHNQILFMGVDFGLIGILLYTSFIFCIVFFKGVLLNTELSRLFVVTFILISFTSHNLLDHYALLLIYIIFVMSIQETYFKNRKLIYY